MIYHYLPLLLIRKSQKLNTFSLKIWLTNKISDRLQRLLLAHQHSDSLLLTVAHKFRVANTAFLPLIVSEPVKFYPHFKYALQTLGTGFDLNLGNINLNKVSLKYVQFAWSLHLRTGRRVLWSQRSLG